MGFREDMNVLLFLIELVEAPVLQFYGHGNEPWGSIEGGEFVL
jgi:hypothetical protein